MLLSDILLMYPVPYPFYEKANYVAEGQMSLQATPRNSTAAQAAADDLATFLCWKYWGEGDPPFNVNPPLSIPVPAGYFVNPPAAWSGRTTIVVMSAS